MKIYCISLLRVCEPGIKNYELKEAYETGFLSELYPGVALSKNRVSTFLNDLGKTVSRIVRFMQNHTSAVSMDHHLLVDGTLKSDESKVNSLSDFSRKARTKGTRDISVLYAFDLEAMEPVCSKCFPGNMLDATSYKAFIAENKITKGIIVADKGFPESAVHEHFAANEDLHYCEQCRAAGELPYQSTQFNKYYAEYVHKTKASMHLNHKPGETMQVDWAGTTAHVLDTSTGELLNAYLFVAILPYSGYAYVEAFLDMKQDAWITAHVNAYRFFGGVTRILTPDNLKTGVIKNSRSETCFLCLI